MAIHLHVQNSQQIVVPIRFDRAVRGAPQRNSPDIDDRGYAMPRPGGWNTTDARGPMVGLTVGQTTRIKVVCEDIDWCAPLYATASSVGNPQFEVVEPAAGQPIPINRATRSGIVKIKGIADTSDGQVLHVRLGDVDGPVLAELEPHVFGVRTLNVALHVCLINSAQTAGSIPRIDNDRLSQAGVLNQLMRLVRNIWRPGGLSFNVNLRHATDPDVYTLSQADRVDFTTAASHETDQIINRNHVRDHCNVYFVRYTPGFLGIGIPGGHALLSTLNWDHPGIIVGVEGTMDASGNVSRRSSTGSDLFQEIANDTAHEIGHYLTLPHAGSVNSPGKNDSYARRQLMHPNNLLPAAAGASSNTSPRFSNVGYGLGGSGQGHRGCLLTMKRYATHNSDGDVARARAHMRSNNLY